MINSVIHAGGKGTRLRESYHGPKALAPIGNHPLLWYHMQPLLASKLVSNYLFTLRNEAELVKDYLNQYAVEKTLDVSYIVEPRPLGRAGSIRYAIENNQLDIDKPCLMSHPDDLIPINILDLVEYADGATQRGKSLILVMARKTVNPFGIGITTKKMEIIELTGFLEKPELPLIPNYYANTGMALYMPEALKKFTNVPRDRKTHPEDQIIPELVKEGKVAVYLVDRWLSVNYESDYEKAQKMGKQGLLQYLNIQK